jgi:hypothetical protein
LRQSIRKSVKEQYNLLGDIGSAQTVQEIERKVVSITKDYKKSMIEDSGIQPSLTEDDMKQYMSQVLQEIGGKNDGTK